MKIGNVKVEQESGRSRLAATIEWEDCERPSQEIYFEVDDALTGFLPRCPDPFLAATLTPALWAGERRIVVADEVCPELIDNLQVAASASSHWFGLKRKITIEAKRRSHLHSTGEREAGFFFSGGIDSLSSLRANRLNFPLDHPGSIKHGIIVFGLEVEEKGAFAHVLAALTELATDANVNLISLSTNIRDLNPDWTFWYQAYMGPGLCAIAQSLSGRLASVVIASDYDVPHLLPHGSHPLMEPYFSSAELKVRYDGMTRTRVEKTRLVADWPAALRHLRVCNKPEFYAAGKLNCGECEKCIRTMLGLIACQALDKCRAFPQTDLSADFVEQKVALHPKIPPFYIELIPALANVGRTDLSDAIQRMWKRYRGEVGWRGMLLRLDRERLNGRLRSLKNAIVPRSQQNGN